MSRLFVTAILLFFSIAVSAEELPIAIGTVYPPLPNNCSEIRGALLDENSAGLRLAFSQIDCGKQIFLLLGKFTKRDENGKAFWELKKIVKLPTLKKNEIINDSNDCSYKSGESNNHYFIAVSGPWKHTKLKSYAPHVSFVIQPNTETIDFEIIDPQKVHCEYFEDRD